MGRSVDHSRPYTEEEKKYLLTRAGGESLIAINERKFAHLSDEDRDAVRDRTLESARKEEEIRRQLEEQQKADEEDSYHPDDVAKVDPMTIADLQDELEKEGLSPDVSKADQGEGDDYLTEKQVLVYRLLNHLDAVRKTLSGDTKDPEDSEDSKED